LAVFGRGEVGTPAGVLLGNGKGVIFFAVIEAKTVRLVIIAEFVCGSRVERGAKIEWQNSAHEGWSCGKEEQSPKVCSPRYRRRHVDVMEGVYPRRCA